MKNNHFDRYRMIARKFENDMNSAREKEDASDPVQVFLHIREYGISEDDKLEALRFFRNYTDSFGRPGMRILSEKEDASVMERTENNIRRLSLAEFGEPIGLVKAVRDRATGYIRLRKGPNFDPAAKFYVRMLSAVCGRPGLSVCRDRTTFDAAAQKVASFCADASKKIAGRTIRSFAELEKMERPAVRTGIRVRSSFQAEKTTGAAAAHLSAPSYGALSRRA